MRLSKLSAWAGTVRVDALIISHWRQKQQARTTWPPKNASRYDVLTRQKGRENDQRLRRWNWTGSLSLFFFFNTAATSADRGGAREHGSARERDWVAKMRRDSHLSQNPDVLLFSSRKDRRKLGGSNQSDDEEGQQAIWAIAAHARPAAPTREETRDILYADMYLGQVNRFTAVGIWCLSWLWQQAHILCSFTRVPLSWENKVCKN